MRKLAICLFLLVSFCSGCSSGGDTVQTDPKNPKGEYIYRKSNETFFTLPPPQKIAPPSYAWDHGDDGSLRRITKEYFRCKGSVLNQHHTAQPQQNGEVVRHFDCSGNHSLPLREGKEFIYPILIELMNFIQDETGKKVVITCGHRCPDHNTYSDPTAANQYSKHMVGAEVDFYVQSLENNPERIVDVIQKYYKITPRYRGHKEYEEFKRYDKNDTNVAIQPWYNKEIFIKVFSKGEGRDFDNRHPYPYLSIQVRHDRDTNERVIYTWDKAFRNFHRK